MLSSKCFKVVLLAIAVIGLGLASAGEATAGSCKSDRGSYDRIQSGKHHNHRSSHSGWHGRSSGVSYHYRSSSHHDYSRSRTKVSYRNDNVRFSVNVGSSRHYDYHQPRYRSSSSCSKTVVYHAPQPSGYWKRVYHGPVYETRYASCGTPYRVCIRAGYYERVWVSTGHRY
ncbi:MAG: hypothetical protein KTR15_10935 [Phycisphaeraceae bacterium]|nr:hypothetical protein [Phycisphaeraceae bacterium]